MDTAKGRSTKTWGIFNAILLIYSWGKLVRKNKKHIDSPKVPTQRSIDTDDYETYSWSAWTYMPSG